MNRRGFLGLVLAAPVVAPMVAEGVADAVMEARSTAWAKSMFSTGLGSVSSLSISAEPLTLDIGAGINFQPISFSAGYPRVAAVIADESRSVPVIEAEAEINLIECMGG